MVRSPDRYTPYFEITSVIYIKKHACTFLFYNYISRICLEKIDDNKYLSITL